MIRPAYDRRDNVIYLHPVEWRDLEDWLIDVWFFDQSRDGEEVRDEYDEDYWLREAV